MFLGIYYNLSIWYKLSHKTMAGAWITITGAAITFGINYLFIPRYGYMACAWATFACYGSMMVISFLWGQKEYRIPYAWKKLTAYIVIVVILYFIHNGITHWTGGDRIAGFLSACLLTLLYTLFVGRVERRELPKLPLIGRYFK
jgi:O-antigen/teichoic acid export membrane protein